VSTDKAATEWSPQRLRELKAFIADTYHPIIGALAQRIGEAPVIVDQFDRERISTLSRTTNDDDVQLSNTAKLVSSRDRAGVGEPVAVSLPPQTYPVGEYGARLAWRLAEAQSLGHTLVQELRFKTQKSLFIKLALSLDDQGISCNASGVDTVDHGLVSILQAAAQFTAYRVNGFDDPYDLLRAIPAHDFVELGARCPVGVLGPMSLNALFFPPPVLRVSDSRAVISSELRTLLLEEQRIYRSDLKRSTQQQQVKRTFTHTTRGRGCPVDFEPLVKPLIEWVHRRELAIRSGKIPDPFQVGRPTNGVEWVPRREHAMPPGQIPGNVRPVQRGERAIAI